MSPLASGAGAAFTVNELAVLTLVPNALEATRLYEPVAVKSRLERVRFILVAPAMGVGPPPASTCHWKKIGRLPSKLAVKVTRPPCTSAEPEAGNVSASKTGAPVMAVMVAAALVAEPKPLVTTTRYLTGVPGVKLVVSTATLILVAPLMSVKVAPPLPLSVCH